MRILGTVAILAAALAAPATAGDPLDPQPAPVVQTYQLRTQLKLWTDNAAAVAAVEAGGAVEKATSVAVAESGERTGRAGLCHATPLAPALRPGGFCWDAADDTSNGWNTTVGGWTPQGLSGSHDADNVNGTVEGRNLFVASWHFGMGPSNANQFARVSIVHNGPSAVTYGHILLVRAAGSSFSAVRAHADGVVWYGNRLFVANGRELQVYDMRHIWRMSQLTDAVGITPDGGSSARGHRWAMPMVGRYWTGATPDVACSVRTGNAPCLNSLSLDRTGADALLSAEHTRAGTATGGRIVRWPLNHTVALPRADNGAGVGDSSAAAAYSAPVPAMQGAATNGTDLFISGQCPGDLAQEKPVEHPDAWTCIYRAAPGREPEVLTMTPRLSQNLSYSRFSGRLWGINERINTTQGVRVVFSLAV
jgi:hypothetical protein